MHSRREVNEAIRKGQYFFTDIRKEGIVLYELDDEPLTEPRPRTPKDAYVTAKEHFDGRLSYARYHHELFQKALVDQQFNHAAFELHQAIEHGYSALLLTLTNYSPPSHNIKFLRSLAEDQDRRLVEAWPRDLPTHRAWFNTLVEAYVKARYSKHYSIDKEGLAWLGEHTAELHDLVEAACKERLAKLKAGIS